MARIIGLIILALVLGVLFYLTGGENNTQPQTQQSQPVQNDSGFKDLKIN